MYANQVFKSGAPNGGPPFKTVEPRKVWARSAATIGRHYRADIHRATAVAGAANSRGITLPAVANWNVGPALAEPASSLNNYIAGGGLLELSWGPFGLALESVAANELMTILEVGVANNVAKVVHAAAGTYQAGSALVVTNGGAALTIMPPAASLGGLTDASALTLFKVVGMLIEPCTIVTNGVAVTAPSIFFNGYGLTVGF